MDSIYPALSGALAQEKWLEVVTNNLANANTGGFKKDRAVFAAVDPNVGVGAPSFGRLDRVVPDLAPGPLRVTGEPLDAALEGPAMFAVQTPDGVRYTRDGRFTLDPQGQLVTAGGFPVLGSGGPITLPAGSVTIDGDGRIAVKGTQVGATPIEVDTVALAQIADPNSLQKVGGGLFAAPAAAPPAAGAVRVRQGMLEGSNVEPVEEMVAMIQILRAYEASQKLIQTADEVAARAAQEIGRIA